MNRSASTEGGVAATNRPHMTGSSL
jgi:hypothetical protein